MRALVAVICPTGQAKFFAHEGWIISTELNSFAKLFFASAPDTRATLSLLGRSAADYAR
jgi:hypothetical protein